MKEEKKYLITEKQKALIIERFSEIPARISFDPISLLLTLPIFVESEVKKESLTDGKKK